MGKSRGHKNTSISMTQISQIQYGGIPKVPTALIHPIVDTYLLIEHYWDLETTIYILTPRNTGSDQLFTERFSGADAATLTNKRIVVFFANSSCSLRVTAKLCRKVATTSCEIFLSCKVWSRLHRKTIAKMSKQIF